MSFAGNPIDSSTINIVTNPAPGILLALTDATAAVKLIINTWTRERSMSLI